MVFTALACTAPHKPAASSACLAYRPTGTLAGSASATRVMPGPVRSLSAAGDALAAAERTGDFLLGSGADTRALLAGNDELARRFTDGSFATLYLSPRDYHRIHMPCGGRLLSMHYVPGELFSVNPATAEGVPGLFARNERVVCEFESETIGRFVLVLVGATIVGSMATAWHGVVNPPRAGTVKSWRYDQQDIVLRQGDEMGRFLLGSTVVMLFPATKLSFNPAWCAGKSVRLGEAMAVRT